jgi:hypothetical protein
MRYIFLLITVLLIGCGDSSDLERSKIEQSDFYKIDDSFSSHLKKTDSLQVLYFDNPDGDSLRYTRFYKYVDSKDSGLIGTLLSDLNQPFEKRNEVKNCRSEGKIFLYDEEKPLKTIYFSNRCDSCCYLYYIQDGAFLYFPISSATSTALSFKKQKSKAP